MLNDELGLQLLIVVVMATAAFRGWRSTFLAYRRHGRIAPKLTGAIYLISISHVIIRLIASVAASWFGFLAVRRLLDFEPIDWSPAISWVFAIVVFFLPDFLDWTERKIAEDESIPVPQELRDEALTSSGDKSQTVG